MGGFARAWIDKILVGDAGFTRQGLEVFDDLIIKANGYRSLEELGVRVLLCL